MSRFAHLLPALSVLAARHAIQKFTDVLEGGEAGLQYYFERLGFGSQDCRWRLYVLQILGGGRKVENQLQLSFQS